MKVRSGHCLRRTYIGQEADAAGRQFVDGPDELEDAFSLAGPGLWRVEHLLHRPADVRLDGGAHLGLCRQGRVDPPQARQNPLEEQRDARALAAAY